ncbi:hypothetical protein PHMEG_00027795 [Phytophthora megakarya]|uniref:BZIP transcription factor n=1 Tax=Phytophthora megakarya TaxID=4795 RepID=A0A225V6E5_9STRA|nr:hypothetical protein PHMEG_00027795 [Phytophthora megakarya]
MDFQIPLSYHSIRLLGKFGDNRREFDGNCASGIEITIGEKNRRRELRRKRQIRYRRKKDDVAAFLDQITNRLQLEIEELQQRHHSILSGVPVKETLWYVAVQYFHQFRYGYQQSATATTGLAPLHVQLEFLRATMALNVTHDSGHGVEALLAHWKTFSLWFKHIEYRLTSLEVDTENSIHANTETSFTITETTLTKVFPHLCENDKSQRSPLANKLLGQRIVMKGSTRLDWDSVFGRVTSISAESDMMAPILSVVDNLEDVCVVFNRSRVGLDFRFR